MSDFLDFLWTLLAQFGGGPGPVENNLVRFGLPAIFWAVLLVVAWSRQRQQELPREKLLVWGFGLGFIREFYMFSHMATRVISGTKHDPLCGITEPVEHALAIAATAVVAGSFLRYILDDARVSRRYLQLGLGATAATYLTTFWWWARHHAANPMVSFHGTWAAWLFHIVGSVLIAVAIVILARKQGWLRNVVTVALSFFFISESLPLLNFATGQVHDYILCPVGNSFHIWAIPLLGFVYLREQAIEKRQAEEALKAYRDHLEERVDARTAELAAQNDIAATLSQSLDLDTVLSAALDRILAVLDMGAGAIFLLDQDAETMMLQAHRGGTASESLAASGQRLPVCECIAGRPVSEMTPVVMDSADIVAERLPPFAEQDNLSTGVCVPLVSKGHAVGLLTLGRRRPGAILPEELELLISVGQQVAMAIENAHLYQAAEHWAGELALLHEVSVLLTSTFDPVMIYGQITEQSAKLLGCQVAILFRWDEEFQEAVGVSGCGLKGLEIGDLRMQLVEYPLLKDLINNRESIPIEVGQTDQRIPSAWRERFDIKAALCLSVWGTGKPLGFLFLVEQRGPRRWHSDEVRLVESFVNRAAIALENALLHKQLEWAAAVEERQRIAAEMHDGLGQTLSYLGLRTDRAVEFLEAGRLEQVQEEFHQIRNTIGQATEDVRQSIATLHDRPPPRRPLQEWLNDIVNELIVEDSRRVELIAGLSAPLFLPPDQLEQVLRVTQEALLNASRHAQAENITVYLEQHEDEVKVTVEDDGQGFNPEAPPRDGGNHFGLSIMRARATRIGGELKIISAPGDGTRVTLTWSLS